ncbi:MAG: diguanylate cyclase [Oscillospiraceae bacterium]|jgi:diguanylate cyclase (GGDEF)-like protein|nr:diguanylate cyclase [Oscillospiraceae bacterium]
MNLHAVLVAATLAAASLIFLVELHIVFRGGAVKKRYFLLLVNSIFILLLGHLIELIGGDTRGAFSGVRLLYLGSALTALFLLFFVADYCNIRFNTSLRAFLTAASLLYVLAAWTTDVTGFLYASMSYDATVTHYLTYTPGPLSHVLRVFPLLYAAAAAVILIYRLRRAKGRLRKALGIMLASVIMPHISEVVFYALSLLRQHRANLYTTPYILSAFVIIIYYGITRYDIDADTVAAFAAMDTISEPFILLDEDMRCLSSNNAARALFPWLRELPRDTPVQSHPGWPAELSEPAFSGGNASVDFEPEDGGRRFSATINPATVKRRGGQALWSVLIRDITESANFIKCLEEAAYTDTLTGLYNRRHFSEIAAPFIERARRAGMPYYFMIADIDDFKDINDAHGHLAGDAVLRGMAQVMKRTVRPYDILARWGGEEFCMIITDIEEAGVLRLAERIRREVEVYECDYMGKRLRVTISGGLARCDDDSDITEITRRADEALYSAKAGGKNRVEMWAPRRPEPDA